MNIEHKNNNDLNQPKRADRYAAWATAASVRRVLANDGMANNDMAVKRVTQFCQAEMARVIAVNVILPDDTLANTFFETLETALVGSFNPDEAVVVRRFVGTLSNGLRVASLMHVANQFPPLEQETAIRVAATIPALMPTPRPLADGELLDAIWTPTRPAFVSAAAAVPAGVLVEVTHDTLVFQAKDIWRHILRAKNLNSDRNLAQTLAWALNFGLPTFKQLPTLDRLKVATGKAVHARVIKPAMENLLAMTTTT